MSPATYFPLRWESTGEQWWYASPIDWAAANGHYDLVRELLRLDANHLIQLTSLRRIRRLETVWDDEAHFHDVATCRSGVARKLLSECEMKKGRNSLIGGGYGGWVLYTAASAGDMGFVRELLERDPLLVFGEGEYGVTDILYAAARSKDSEVFKVVLDYAAAPRLGGEEQIPAAYRVEIMNRAIHAAARGGNVRLLKELLGDDDALAYTYRDVQGATVLHAAAARGQVEVVRDLASSCGGLVDATDNEGNTALHAAALRGHLGVVEALILASPSSITATNNAGDTFLHAVVAGFQTPGFRRLDRQIQLMTHLLSFPAAAGVERIINARNKQGRTALHLAITLTPNSNLVQLLMTVPSIDVNIRDLHGFTPLDILRQQQRPLPCSELLTRQLISAGGIFSSQDYSARRVIASHIKRQSMGSSPGTSFRISDVEIFLYTGLDNGSPSPSVAFTSYSPPQLQAAGLSQTLAKTTAAVTSPGSSAAQRLKRLLHWTKMSKEKLLRKQKLAPDSEEVPLPLRQRYSSNKRALSVRSGSSQPSPTPTAKKKQANRRSRSSSFSNSKISFSSHSSLDMAMGKGVENEGGNGNGKAWCSSSTTNPNPNPNPYPIGEGEGVIKRSHLHKRAVMNQYLCFGGPSGGEETEVQVQVQVQPYEIYERSVLAAA